MCDQERKDKYVFISDGNSPQTEVMNKVMDICVEVRKRRGGQSCSKHESQPKNSDLVL